MKYEDIKNPVQLLEYMNQNIKYGFVDEDNNIYDASNNDKFQKASLEKWKLSSPEKLIQNQYGQCWDQVEFERDWFLKNGYNCKTYFIIFLLDYKNTYTTHTYLIYEDNKKYYYFEHSDFNNRGIKEFATEQDAIKYQYKKHIEHNSKFNIVGEKEINCIHIYEYKKPQYGINFRDFIDNILENSKEIKL